jgi:hypothetical protein
MVYNTNDSEDFTEDQLRELVWMPAHGTIASVGVATMSDGNKVSILQWRANRLVDLLAKSAARPHRIHAKTRVTLQDAFDTLEFSLGMLGAVTFAANNHKTSIHMPDGTTNAATLRDSAGAKALRYTGTSRGAKRKAEHGAMVQAPCKTLCIPIGNEDSAHASRCTGMQRRSSIKKQTAADHEADCDLKFRLHWFASRPDFLKPNSDRPATDRRNELRLRVAAREAESRARLLDSRRGSCF